MTIRQSPAALPRGRSLAPLVVVILGVLVAFGWVDAGDTAAASGPTLKLSRTSGPKNTIYSATYSYVPNEGAGCDISASLEWDGITAGGGFHIQGFMGCKETQTGLLVPGPPRGTPGKHRVCAVVQNVQYPQGVTLPTRCVTFTVTGTATPRPTTRSTPKLTSKPATNPTSIATASARSSQDAAASASGVATISLEPSASPADQNAPSSAPTATIAPATVPASDQIDAGDRTPFVAAILILLAGAIVWISVMRRGRRRSSRPPEG
jgi:hypothetical protein